MATRRQFLKATVSGAGLLASWKLSARALAAPPSGGGALNPRSIPKYVAPLVIPPPMPRASRTGRRMPRNADYYEIAVRQFSQEILPPRLPRTTVWSYGSIHHPGTFNYPAFTIEATVNKPVRVQWINGLVDSHGSYLPHLLPVDPTLHWANPPGPIDMRPSFESTPGPYTGPVPIVTHVHGAHVTPESDGYPEAWFLPNANNIPAGYAAQGSHFDQFDRTNTHPGSAVFQYRNDQAATTLSYHDHTLGMTRLNVYAGPAGFYLLRGGKDDLPSGILPGPAPGYADPAGMRHYEIPIAIQDRSFHSDGSLFYPDSRRFFDGFRGPYIPESDISPIWNPEFFGNTTVVNGRTWPYLEVEPRRYRFRFLNGCNSRFLILKMVTNPLASRPATAALPFWQIGAEGGFLPAPVMLDQLLMGLAERADVVVDFTGLEPGTEMYLINEGPDEPFGGGVAGTDFPSADPSTTGQVMKFKVVPLASTDVSWPPEALGLPSFRPLGPEIRIRRLSLNEEDSAVLPGVGPRAALLGTLNDYGFPIPHMWEGEITEKPRVGDTEIWELYNFTADAHPIHLHLVQFQVVNRQALVTDAEGMAAPPAQLVGDPMDPEPWETGYKDTVIAYPGQVTRLKAKFDIPGLYVWHCHIVEHEDNEMMRPYEVVG